MISREEMIRRGKQMDTLEYKPVTLKESKPYWEAKLRQSTL
ncbi:hypothetical protein C5167_042777 [Papaver somniferum]|uniref:Uncharacterized protein n=1 Tax=Papaver somniferum TaxID=3469 RepID=A0A4Y7L7P2_PAPSO|nr:hypothetical protein C5167_042777 [Papaver somniferum]